MMKIRNLSLLLIFISLFCEAQSQPIVTSIENPENDGMIVGTITLSNRNKKNYKKVFSLKKSNLPFEKSRKETRKAIDSLKRNGNLSDYYDRVNIEKNNCDFLDANKCVYFFTLVKPKGEYHFYTLQIISAFRGNINPIKLISLEISFEIEPGKIKYLGEINYDEKSGTVELINNIERDRLNFSQRFPNITF